MSEGLHSAIDEPANTRNEIIASNPSLTGKEGRGPIREQKNEEETNSLAKRGENPSTTE